MSKNINRSIDNRSDNDSKNINKFDSDKDSNILDEVNDQLRNVRNIVSGFVEKSRENLFTLEEKLEERIRANPIKICSIIFVAGALLGAFLKRR